MSLHFLVYRRRAVCSVLFVTVIYDCSSLFIWRYIDNLCEISKTLFHLCRLVVHLCRLHQKTVSDTDLAASIETRILHRH